MDELENLLIQVPDVYDDFVLGMKLYAKKYGTREAVVDFLKNNPNASTSDVLKFHRSLTGKTKPLPIID